MAATSQRVAVVAFSIALIASTHADDNTIDAHFPAVGGTEAPAKIKAPHGAKHHRRRLFSLLVLGAFLSGCSAIDIADPGAEELNLDRRRFQFQQYEVLLGSAKRQTVLTGFLLGNKRREGYCTQ